MVERGSEFEVNDALDVWVNGKDYDLSDLREEMRLLGTSLPPSDLEKLFRFESPLMATPTMIEDFAQNWEDPDFSLAPLLSSIIGRLITSLVESHYDYKELRAYFRALVLSNLLRSGWRTNKKDQETEIIQRKFDKDMESRLKRLVNETHSDYWALFSDQSGVEKWKRGQAEVLSYMETASPTWRKIFQKTKKDLS